MPLRSTLLEKIFAAVLIAGYVTYVIPRLGTGNFFANFVVVITIAVIAFSLGKIFSGEGGKAWLIPIVLVIIGSVLLLSLGVPGM